MGPAGTGAAGADVRGGVRRRVRALESAQRAAVRVGAHAGRGPHLGHPRMCFPCFFILILLYDGSAVYTASPAAAHPNAYKQHAREQLVLAIYN